MRLHGEPPAVSTLICALVAVSAVCPVDAQFIDEFEGDSIASDARGLDGWSHFTGDGEATMTFRGTGDGHAAVRVDATRDRRGVWWALIKRAVSDRLDLDKLRRPGYELRVEARIRVSHAPRRVNLHVNTQRTTDFHSHLMEFDIPDTTGWHTISMTTREFPTVVGDTVYGQLALMDWGPQEYGVDIDYFRVDVVDTARVGPDRGEAVPYDPPVPDPGAFREAVTVAHDATIDLADPSINLNGLSAREEGVQTRLIAVDGSRYALLRFDLDAFAGRTVQRGGLLELTTHSVRRAADEAGDSGLVRVVEILDAPAWDQATVTAGSLFRDVPIERVLNPQMVVDGTVTEGRDAKTRFTISRPVLQRLIDGRTAGLAMRPLGSISAAFYAMEHDEGRLGARLYFDVRPDDTTGSQEPGDTLVVPVPGTEVDITLAYIPGEEPFWMAVHEVTHDQFAPFRYRRLDADVAAGDADFDADAVTRPSPPYEDPVHGMGKEGHPAGGMTRLAALSYARWLSEKTGRLFRLPTEAEWERACLAGGPGPYGPGIATDLADHAWYEANSRGAFHPVGSKAPNTWGLHDMHGNVAEWVMEQPREAWTPATLRGRGVVRGGAFDDPPESLRCDARFEEPAAWKQRDPQIPKSRWWNTDSPHVGFRLVSPVRELDAGEIEAYWADLPDG